MKILDGQDIQYSPVSICTPENVIERMEELEDALNHSKLPDEPQHKDELYDWLYNLRASQLKSR